MTPFYKKQQTNKQKRLKPPKTELFPEIIAKLVIPMDVIYEYILSLLVYSVCFKFNLSKNNVVPFIAHAISFYFKLIYRFNLVIFYSRFLTQNKVVCICVF